MDLSLTGKTALVCGSTQGIGLAIAKELALLGANCILLARNEGSLLQALPSLNTSKHQQHSIAVADFDDNEQVRTTIQESIAKQPIHILINNTGGPKPGPLLETPANEMEIAFRQHIVNYQQLAQAVVPSMKASGYGRIVNIISTSVKIPIANLGVSNTIRAATAGWAKTLANELGRFGITVNNILPGFTNTKRLEGLIKANSSTMNIGEAELVDRMQQQIPLRRFGQPAEIAAVAAFLCSPSASYVNGTSIPVDGGSTGAF